MLNVSFRSTERQTPCRRCYPSCRSSAGSPCSPRCRWCGSAPSRPASFEARVAVHRLRVKAVVGVHLDVDRPGLDVVGFGGQRVVAVVAGVGAAGTGDARRLVSSAITSGLQDFTCDTAATSNCTPPISKFFTPAPGRRGSSRSSR